MLHFPCSGAVGKLHTFYQVPPQIIVIANKKELSNAENPFKIILGLC